MDLQEKLRNLNSIDQLAARLAASGEISSSLQKAINAGKVRMIPTVKRVRKSFPGAVSGTVDLLDNNQDEEVGVSDFQGQRIEDGSAIIGLGTSLRFLDVAQADIATADFSAALPGAVKGALVRTLSNGRLITEQSGIDYNVAGDNTEVGTEVLEHEIPRFYGDGKKFEVKLEFGPSATLAAANNGNAFEFAIYGFVTQYV